MKRNGFGFAYYNGLGSRFELIAEIGEEDNINTDLYTELEGLCVGGVNVEE